MGTTSWEDLSRRWRELYDQQVELARSFGESQVEMARQLTAAVAGEQPEAQADVAAELWRSWMALGGSLARTMPGIGEPGVAAETLGRLLDPISLSLVGGSQVGEAIRRMTEGPRFADLGTLERRIAGVMERWLEVQAAARRYESVVASAWVQADQRFARELAERQAPGKVADPKEALKLWLDVANRALLETHRSPPFLDAQRDLLRHGMDFLLGERELVESLLEPAGVPTRSEVDEVHRSVQDLKRRMRRLEKAVARLVDGHASPAPSESASGEPGPAAVGAAR